MSQTHTPIQDVLSRAGRWRSNGVSGGPKGADSDFKSLIQNATAEHAALLRVAEAARNLTADNGQRALDEALANLSAVQANL